MDPGTPPRAGRGLTAMDGAIALIAILVIVQMWVLTASLESDLAGHREVAIPAAVLSAVIFVGSLALYLFIRRLDRQIRKG